MARCDDESQACKDARDEYFSYEGDRDEQADLAGDWQRKSDFWMKAALTGAGVSFGLALSGVGAIWALGVGAASVGALLRSAYCDGQAENARSRCRQFRALMMNARTAAMQACRLAECVPPTPPMCP